MIHPFHQQRYFSRFLTRVSVVFGFFVAIGSHNSYVYAVQRCFSETGFCIDGRFREFWEQNGGLPVFGFPIAAQTTQMIEGKSYQVQLFERYRFELHPEQARPYDVLLGRLGADRIAQQGRKWQDFPRTPSQPGCRFFEQTGHAVCGDILAMWRANGLEFDGQSGKSESESIALFGLPLSSPQSEILSDGRTYTVQWFERARFELHPEHAPPYHVLLGLLAQEIHESNQQLTADSTILSPPRASAEQTIAYIVKRGTPYSEASVREIVGHYWRIATEAGVDPLLAIAQNIHETGNMTSWWSQRPRRNPAGLGVTGETSKRAPPADQQHAWAWDEKTQTWMKGLSFATWEDSVRAHIGRLLAYALKDRDANRVQRTLIQDSLALRPLPSEFRGIAPTLRGLNRRWAVPGEDYADRIVRVAKQITGK